MKYKSNLEAIKRALRIHRKRHIEGLCGTRFLVRETIHYQWERRDNRSKWHAPRWISVAAKKNGRKDWTYEHAIPLNVVVSKLDGLGTNASLAQIRRVLTKWDIPVIVTKKEGAALKQMGLASKMPRGWRYNQNPFARYRRCRIKPVSVD
jgi:hypothetical protein